MNRYFFEISYDGTNFFGWQIQPTERTVQGTIEDVLFKLCSLKHIQIVGCGRTDTGVHAKKYFFHADMELKMDEEKFMYKLNCMLPQSISVQSLQQVNNNLHARFDAKLRTYRYFIHPKKDPFKKSFSWFISQSLDFELMQKAANTLIGTQDFEAFSKKHTDVKSHICNVSNACFLDQKQGVVFEISANRFLRNMVRAIVGTLIEVGLRKLSIEDFQKILDSRDRQKAAASAPSEGLYLWDVIYPIQRDPHLQSKPHD